MIDWRTARTYEELFLYMPEGHGHDTIKRIEKDLSDVNGFKIKDIARISEFDDETGKRVLNVLLEWACYYFEYDDEWNYRRLLEVVDLEIPQAMEEILEINKTSTNQEILECIEDFS